MTLLPYYTVEKSLNKGPKRQTVHHSSPHVMYTQQSHTNLESNCPILNRYISMVTVLRLVEHFICNPTVLNRIYFNVFRCLLSGGIILVYLQSQAVFVIRKERSQFVRCRPTNMVKNKYFHIITQKAMHKRQKLTLKRLNFDNPNPTSSRGFCVSLQVT